MKIMQNNNYIQKLYSRLDPQIILIKNKMGDTILHYAAYKKNKDIISYLLKNGA